MDDGLLKTPLKAGDRVLWQGIRGTARGVVTQVGEDESFSVFWDEYLDLPNFVNDLMHYRRHHYQDSYLISLEDEKQKTPVLDPKYYKLTPVHPDRMMPELYLTGEYPGPMNFIVFAVAVKAHTEDSGYASQRTISDDPVIYCRLRRLYALTGDHKKFKTIKIGNYPHDYVLWMEPAT